MQRGGRGGGIGARLFPCALSHLTLGLDSLNGNRLVCLECLILYLKHRRSSKTGSYYYHSFPHLKADLASKVEKMRQSILEGVNMNHPSPSALLPSPTFVPPMVPSLYPVSLYSQAMGSLPPPPQGRSRRFAGQYLRMRYLSSSVYFTVTHPVIFACYRINSVTYVLPHLPSVLCYSGLKRSLLRWRGVACGRKSTNLPDHTPSFIHRGGWSLKI